MKSRIAAAFLVAGTLLIPIGAYAEDKDADRAHPITFVKDSVITVKVKAMLADDKLASLAHVQVDTDSKGAVLLSGNVRSRDQEAKAVSIARGVEGVTSVKSTLQVKKDD